MNRIKEKWRNLEKKTGTQIASAPFFIADFLQMCIRDRVTRDRLMEEYDKVLPGYGFASNKGYGSAEHIKALQTLGPTPIHRRSFIGHFV